MAHIRTHLIIGAGLRHNASILAEAMSRRINAGRLVCRITFDACARRTEGFIRTGRHYFFSVLTHDRLSIHTRWLERAFEAFDATAIGAELRLAAGVSDVDTSFRRILIRGHTGDDFSIHGTRRLKRRRIAQIPRFSGIHARPVTASLILTTGKIPEFSVHTFGHDAPLSVTYRFCRFITRFIDAFTGYTGSISARRRRHRSIEADEQIILIKAGRGKGRRTIIAGTIHFDALAFLTFFVVGTRRFLNRIHEAVERDMTVACGLISHGITRGDAPFGDTMPAVADFIDDITLRLHPHAIDARLSNERRQAFIFVLCVTGQILLTNAVETFFVIGTRDGIDRRSTTRRRCPHPSTIRCKPLFIAQLGEAIPIFADGISGTRL